MPSDTIPLAVPEELHQEIRYTADLTHLSQADVMRQSIKLGLPRLREQLKAERTVCPLTKQETRVAFGPDPEWDSLEMAMASKRSSPPWSAATTGSETGAGGAEKGFHFSLGGSASGGFVGNG